MPRVLPAVAAAIALWAVHVASFAAAQSLSAGDFASRTKVASVYFSFNSAVLDEFAHETIHEIANDLERLNSSNSGIVVVGHTDGVGSKSYNLRLSAARAQAVASELSKFTSSSVSVEWEGETRLSEPTQPDADANRRVDIFLECGFQEDSGFCSCHPDRETESIVVVPEAEVITQEWIVSARIEESTISSCLGSLVVETRFIDVQLSSVYTRSRLVSSFAGSNEEIILWNGTISNGDELIVSILNSTRQCGIGLDFSEYSTIEFEASLVGSELIPLVTAGAAMADLSSQDEYLFRSSARDCIFDISLRIGQVTPVAKPF